MRFALGLAAMLALLAGCSPVDLSGSGASTATKTSVDGTESGGGAIGSEYDYRYNFRLPAARIGQVQDSHVRACDDLGRARCRITVNRYHVDSNDNSVSAILAFQIDPTIARTFGRAAGATVKNAAGLVMDSRMIGNDGASRTSSIVGRMRDEISSIDNQLRTVTSDEQRQAAINKQARLRAAINTIAELDQSTTQRLATTPMLFVYQSGTVIPSLGGSSTATFDNAGQTFVQSAAAMAQVLAGVGPWLLLLLGGALILRRFVQPDTAPIEREREPERNRDYGVPVAADGEHRTVINRWFGRDKAEEAEPEQV